MSLHSGTLIADESWRREKSLMAGPMHVSTLCLRSKRLQATPDSFDTIIC